MYRQILIPTKEYHSIKLPKNLYGKKIEVVIKEVTDVLEDNPVLPKGLKNKTFWEDVPYNPDFPSIEKIREIAWPEKKE